MNAQQLSQSRFLVGIALVIVAVALMVFAEGSYAVAGAVAFAVLGLVSIAISRR